MGPPCPLSYLGAYATQSAEPPPLLRESENPSEFIMLSHSLTICRL